MNECIAALNQQFVRLHEDLLRLVRALSFTDLFQKPSKNGHSAFSPCAEQLLRSAGAVEQTFGGMTTNLWDDPFEWTQPETLSSADKIIEYFQEVEATRLRGFGLLTSDADLSKEIMAPSGETTLLPLLLDTLVRAADHLGRARAAAAETSEYKVQST